MNERQCVRDAQNFPGGALRLFGNLSVFVHGGQSTLLRIPLSIALAVYFFSSGQAQENTAPK